MKLYRNLNKRYKTYIERCLNIINERKPIILQSDYDAEFKNRYFAKHYCLNKIIEIDKDTYLALLNGDEKYDHVYYNIIKITWKLVGPVNDKKDGKEIIYGVYDTNVRSIRSAKELMPGIEKKLLNPLEYTQYDKNKHISKTIYFPGKNDLKDQEAG